MAVRVAEDHCPTCGAVLTEPVPSIRQQTLDQLGDEVPTVDHDADRAAAERQAQAYVEQHTTRG